MFRCRQGVHLQNTKVPFKVSSFFHAEDTLIEWSFHSGHISGGPFSLGAFFESSRNGALFCDTVLDNLPDFCILLLFNSPVRLTLQC